METRRGYQIRRGQVNSSGYSASTTYEHAKTQIQQEQITLNHKQNLTQNRSSEFNFNSISFITSSNSAIIQSCSVPFPFSLLTHRPQHQRHNNRPVSINIHLSSSKALTHSSSPSPHSLSKRTAECGIQIYKNSSIAACSILISKHSRPPPPHPHNHAKQTNAPKRDTQTSRHV